MSKNKKTEKKTSKKALAKAEKEKKKQERKLVQKHYISEILPVVRWNPDLECAIMEDGMFMDILGIRQQNLEGAAQDTINYYNNCWDRLYKTYSDDLKLIFFVFPTDVEPQLEYIDYILSKTEHPRYRELLNTKKYEFEWLAQNRQEKAAVLCFYAKNYDDYKDKFGHIKSMLSDLIFYMEPNKKIELLRLLNNKTLAL